MTYPILENFCHLIPYLGTILLGTPYLGNFAFTFDPQSIFSFLSFFFFNRARPGKHNRIPPPLLFFRFTSREAFEKNTPILNISGDWLNPRDKQPKIPSFPRYWEHACGPCLCRLGDSGYKYDVRLWRRSLRNPQAFRGTCHQQQQWSSGS